MNIGIIIYSQTGHTLEVSHKLKIALEQAQHQVTVHPLEIEGEIEPSKPVKFAALPDITGHDAYIFAAPVQAFSLCIPMREYLTKAPELDQKPTACFVTRQLKSPLMGGNKALRQLTKALEAKGAALTKTAMISWKDEVREAQMASAIESILSAF